MKTLRAALRNLAFRMYCHATLVPELVSYVRGVGRDCEYRPFAAAQALLIVRAR